MNSLYDDKPIIACSTGTLSNTAIGLIRLSGFPNLEYLQEFFSFDLSKIKKRYAHMSNIIDGDKVLDNIVLTYFEGPNSYNGENILELSVHGNQINIRNILDRFVLTDKFRHAKEGEFTYRALLNKKLSLSQVEGLDLLLNANSSLMLDQGLQTMQGELHKCYMALYDSFVKLKSAVELSIDFSEDVGDEQSQKLFNDSLSHLAELITSLKQRTSGNISSLTAPDIVLVGQTNAGKSSLFNKLLKNNRSIVSSTAGTTRDYVSEFLFLDGVNFRLVDTAGIRETIDNIEKIGIERSFEILDNGFFNILVVNPYETNFEDYKKLPEMVFDLLIISHFDKSDSVEKSFLSKLPKAKKVIHLSLGDSDDGAFKVLGPMGASDNASIEPGKTGPMGAKNSGPIEPKMAGPMGAKLDGPIEPKITGPMGAEKSGPIEPISEAVYNNFNGLELVKHDISNKFNMLAAQNPILVDRHRQVIESIFDDLTRFQDVIDDIDDIAIISSELNLLGHKISELIGVVSADDVLGSIFSNFCIGK